VLKISEQKIEINLNDKNKRPQKEFNTFFFSKSNFRGNFDFCSFQKERLIYKPPFSFSKIVRGRTSIFLKKHSSWFSHIHSHL